MVAIVKSGEKSRAQYRRAKCRGFHLRTPSHRNSGLQGKAMIAVSSQWGAPRQRPFNYFQRAARRFYLEIEIIVW